MAKGITITEGDLHGVEVVFRIPAGRITEARRIERAADDEGIIQAWDMVELFPGKPELHTTTRLYTALCAAGFTSVDKY